MNPRSRFARWLLLPVGGLIAGGALVMSGGLISAQTPNPTDTTTPSASPTIVVPGASTPGPSTTPGAMQNQSNVQSYDQLLADELGIDVGKLRDAQSNARDRYFDQLVQSGDLTQQQAASLKASSSDQMMANVVGNGQAGFIRSFALSQIADILNMDTSQLKQDLSQGKSLQDIADQQGMSVQDIRSELQSRADQFVSTAEDAGVINSDDAANLRDAIQNVLDSIFNSSSAGATPSGTPTPIATP